MCENRRAEEHRLLAEIERLKEEHKGIIECLEEQVDILTDEVESKDAEIVALKGKNKALRKKNKDLKSKQKYDTCGGCARAIHCSGRPTCADFINECEYIGSEEYQYQESKRRVCTPREEPS